MKKERYTYIKAKVKLKVVKAILLVIITMLSPLIIYSKGNMSFIAVGILSIPNFYFFNIVLAFLIKYLRLMYWGNVLYRLIYIIGIVALVIAVIKLEIFISEQILLGLIRRGSNSFNFYSESYIMILSISLLIEIILQVILLKLVKNNLHVIANNSNRYNLLGINGTGKIILFKLMNEDLSSNINLSSYEDEILYAHDEMKVYEYFTEDEFIRLILSLKKMKLDESKYQSILDKLLMREKINEPISTYSFGMKHKLILIISLLLNYRYIL